MTAGVGWLLAWLKRRAKPDERALFDADYYRATYADVAASGTDPFGHFMAHGWREGRNPSPRFSTLFYRDRHLAGAAVNPLSHYVRTGRASGLATAPRTPEDGLAAQREVVADGFDANFYLARAGKVDRGALDHYLVEGWRKGFPPNPRFDPHRYGQENAFVAALGISPFYHCLSQLRLHAVAGAGRSAPPPANVPRAEIRAAIAGDFDARFYLRSYADLATAGIDLLDHFVDHGWRERRNPNAIFDTGYYLSSNPEVAAAKLNPLFHYVSVGRGQGRRPNPVGLKLYPPLPAPQDWTTCERAADVAQAECVVIMPVYRGHDETLAAIHAVLSAPQRTRFALHVVDDASPDRRLADKLAELAASGLFSLERNPTNLGFVKSCNQDLRAFADRDVVLLNADTSVHGDWLDRMRAHAAEDQRIATVTPLSNNATICSYPLINANNLVETECSAATLDEIAAVCNRGRASDLPTGVGFCFFMSRSSRATLGELDEIAFGRGYGEENDFCLRAAKAGYRNVLAEDVFVYHAGQVSFADSAAGEYGPGQATLLGKHPDYPARVGQHLAADPGFVGRMRLDLARLARFAQNGIVFVTHALEGGIATHIRHMEKRLSEEGVRVITLRVGIGDRWGVQFSSGAPDAPFCPNLTPVSIHQIRALIAEFLGWMSPRAIHVHSVVGFDWRAVTDLLGVVQSSAIPYYVTLHDYSVVCHRNDLVTTDGRYCGLPDVAVCRRCVESDRSYPEALDPAVRRHTFEAFLAGATGVFAPSRDIAARLQAAGACYAVAVRPHEDAAPLTSLAAAPQTDRAYGGLRVVTVGAIGLHKGSQVVLNLARDAKARQLSIRYDIVGYSDRPGEMEQAGVVESGPYGGDEEAVALVRALRPDCILLPSIWPETFCFALSLAFRLGIPPVVFDLGAQRDRVAASGFGFVVPQGMLDRVQEFNDLLCRLPYAEAVLATPEPNRRYPRLLVDYYGMTEPGAAPAQATARRATNAPVI